MACRLRQFSLEYLTILTQNTSNMKSIISIIGVSLLMSMASVNAQSSENARKYRVTAVKKGNPQVLSLSNEIEVTRNLNIYVPSAFTPNGDGLNETFGAIGEGISTFTMLIFNRWGEMIYESDDINTQWDGTYKGIKVYADTYVYKIFATGQEKGIFKQVGKVSVVI